MTRRGRKERARAGMGALVKPRLGHGAELGCAVSSMHVRAAGCKLGRCGAGHVQEEGKGGMSWAASRPSAGRAGPVLGLG